MDILQRLLREPLFHFLIIGGLLFFAYTALNTPDTSKPEVIEIGPERISQIKGSFYSVWKRQPGSDELSNLIEEEIRSEVYYRDALALGLDKNDVIIRRRLRQKLEFLSDTGQYLKAPTETQIQAYYTEHKQDYQRQPSLAFEQLFLGQNPSQQTLEKTLNELQSRPDANLSTLGQPSSLPPQLRLSRASAIDSIFGQNFFTQIKALPPGIWAGPILSSYGTHLVRTLGEAPGETPLLEDIRDRLISNISSTRALQAREQDFAERRSRYTIILNP